MPKGAGMTTFAIRYIMNIVRTWYLFHLKYPWVKYNGFVRVMAHTTFARGMKISIGHNVQFGEYCTCLQKQKSCLVRRAPGRVGAFAIGKVKHALQIPQGAVPAQFLNFGKRGAEVCASAAGQGQAGGKAVQLSRSTTKQW